jgi:hypothetical protein
MGCNTEWATLSPRNRANVKSLIQTAYNIFNARKRMQLTVSKGILQSKNNLRGKEQFKTPCGTTLQWTENRRLKQIRKEKSQWRHREQLNKRQFAVNSKVSTNALSNKHEMFVSRMKEQWSLSPKILLPLNAATQTLMRASTKVQPHNKRDLHKVDPEIDESSDNGCSNFLIRTQNNSEQCFLSLKSCSAFQILRTNESAHWTVSRGSV